MTSQLLFFRMRVISVMCLGVVGLVLGKDVPLEPLVGYHEAVGIPLAQQIKADEDVSYSDDTDQYDYSEYSKDIYGNRIIGGDFAPATSHPFLAGLVISLLGKDGNSVCGSSLLTSDRLVTAAHCWNDGRDQAWQFTVVLGSQLLFHGGTRIATSQVITHPQYNSQILTDDVAMIYLPTRVQFTPSIEPVLLPSGSQLWDTFVDDWATAVGYGMTSDSQTSVILETQVSVVSLRVISNSECEQAYGTDTVTDGTLCTSGDDTVGICGGDSGGPLTIVQDGQTTLIGISSFKSVFGCQRGHPSGFARVTSYLTFILQHL